MAKTKKIIEDTTEQVPSEEIIKKKPGRKKKEDIQDVEKVESIDTDINSTENEESSLPISIDAETELTKTLTEQVEQITDTKVEFVSDNEQKETVEVNSSSDESNITSDPEILEEIDSVKLNVELGYMAGKYVQYLVYTSMTPGQFLQKYSSHKFKWAVEEIVEFMSKNELLWEDVVKKVKEGNI